MLPIVNNVDEETAELVDLEQYTREEFPGDLARITHRRCDRDLGRELVEESNETIKWLAKNGLNFQLSFNRQVILTSMTDLHFAKPCWSSTNGNS